jgi:hypothetical protein
MNLELALATYLRSYAPLTTTLTGGIYTVAELGQRGLAYGNPACASAWQLVNALPTLKPCLVVRHRSTTPDYNRADVPTAETGMFATLELWFYAAGGAWPTLDAASGHAYKRLQLQSVAGVGHIRLAGSLPSQASVDFDDAAMRRDDYLAKFIQRG